MAMAARVTVVEVENPVVAAGRLDPDDIHLPGVYVNRIVEITPDRRFVLEESLS
jgi:acyl CoA:acetate/3-ketoacid CoA transferase alpha subunit